jgi:hypothetical protein
MEGRMELLQFYLGALVGSMWSPMVWVGAILIGLLLRRLLLIVFATVVAGLLIQIVADFMLNGAGLPIPPIGASAMLASGQATAVLIIALAIKGCRRLIAPRQAADGRTKSGPVDRRG